MGGTGGPLTERYSLKGEGYAHGQEPACKLGGKGEKKKQEHGQTTGGAARLKLLSTNIDRVVEFPQTTRAGERAKKKEVGLVCIDWGAEGDL